MALFPHGVLPTALDAGRVRPGLSAVPPNAKIIAAYGFLLPHKGLQQLACQVLIKKRQLQQRVTLITDQWPLLLVRLLNLIDGVANPLSFFISQTL